MSNVKFYDLRSETCASDLSVIFPGWNPAREKVVIISPHDDDAALGAGYLMLSCVEEGAGAHIIVMCDGRAGYTRPELRDDIVEIRKTETVKAYSTLGISAERIHRLDYPDFSLASYIDRKSTRLNSSHIPLSRMPSSA